MLYADAQLGDLFAKARELAVDPPGRGHDRDERGEQLREFREVHLDSPGSSEKRLACDCASANVAWTLTFAGETQPRSTSM